jgi:hypothetical protein
MGLVAINLVISKNDEKPLKSQKIQFLHYLISFFAKLLNFTPKKHWQ